MTDFLTNLAARTLAQPRLRPRTRMRFEPVEGDVAMEAEYPSPRPSLRDRGERVAEGPARDPEERHTVMPPPPAHLVTQTISSVPEVVTETHEVPVTNTVLVPRERSVTITKEKRIVIPQDRTHVVPIPSRAAIEGRAETTRAVEAAPHERDEAAPGTQPHQPAETPAFRERTRNVQNTRTIDRTEHTRERLTRTLTRETHAQAEPGSEPAIHVSIGRVEVRAIAPPAATPKTPAQKPMSIDDYVAQRERKERR
jgi:hypothetical protein